MPKFVYSRSCIRARYKELAAILPAGSTIYYSVKANANLQVLTALARLGLSAELSSVGELSRVVEAGFSSWKSIYGGPGKTHLDFETALSWGVRRFSLESLYEMQMLDEIKPGRSDVVRIVRVLHPSQRSGLNMMAPDSKFGVTLSELESYIHAGGQVDGIHLYYGTQQKFADFVDSIGVTNRIVETVEALLGRRLDYINYGGGLEWPFMRNGLQIAKQGADLPVLARQEVCFEFGRYLVASCGTLQTRVLDTKIREGRQVLVVDAGIQTIGGVSATGRIFRADAEFIWPGLSSESFLDTAVYGPLCTSADYLTLATKLPIMPHGATLSIANCGAYGSNTGLVDFLMRSRAEEVTID